MSRDDRAVQRSQDLFSSRAGILLNLRLP
jgi:hypothetical protein